MNANTDDEQRRRRGLINIPELRERVDILQARGLLTKDEEHFFFQLILRLDRGGIATGEDVRRLINIMHTYERGPS